MFQIILSPCHEIYILDHQDDIQEYAKNSLNLFSHNQLAPQIGTVRQGFNNLFCRPVLNI